MIRLEKSESGIDHVSNTVFEAFQKNQPPHNPAPASVRAALDKAEFRQRGNVGTGSIDGLLNKALAPFLFQVE